MLSQKRIIEKRGLIIFTEIERKALELSVHVIVRQIPRNLPSFNYKIYPNRSFFGWATLMHGISVREDIQLQFYNQCIFHYSRAIEQAAGNNINNFDTILSVLQTLSVQITPPLGVVSKLPTVPVKYAFCPASLIHFELIEGVVMEIQSHIIPLDESSSLFVEETNNSSPPEQDNGSKNSPPSAPPPGGSPTTKRWDDTETEAPFTITSPYDGIDDGGRTYQPPFVPPWNGEDGQDVSKLYRVRVEEIFYTGSGSPTGEIWVTTWENVPGKIRGLGTLNPNSGDADYGILTTNANKPIVRIGSNYGYKIGWPPGFQTSYRKARIIDIVRMN